MMVEKFLPVMRAMVARHLRAEGFSQSRIAALLGVTQASVSLYLGQEDSVQLRLLAELGMTYEEGERYSSLLSEDLKRDPLYAVSTLYSVWSDMLRRGALCPAHRTDYPFLAQCEMCTKAFGQTQGRDEAIELVLRAVKALEGSGIFTHVMPQVSVNVAYAQEGAKGVEDVVAIPGRIVRVRDRARALMRPEFGASTHLAKVLLTARSRMREHRAAINLRLDARMRRVLKKMKVRTVKIGETYGVGVDPVVETLSARLEGSDERFDAIAASGGAGIEPSLYLFASTPVEVAERAIAIARLYSTGLS